MKAEDNKAADAEKAAAEKAEADKAAAEKEAADKAAAEKEAKSKAKADDAPGVQATCIEISGLGRYAMRLTEVGNGVELHNGAVVKLPVDVAKSLCERYPANIKMKDADGYSLKTEKVAPDFKGEIVKNVKPNPVATEKASGKPSKEGQAANKNVGKAPATKG